jgi:5-methylcytosine-specific restriction endonuclease McrA
MPNRPGIACTCGGVRRNGVCDRNCQTSGKAQQRQYDAARGPGRQWYSKTRWRKFRAYVLSKRPYCERCEEEGNPKPSEGLHVHHVKDRSTHPELAYDEDNVIVLCQGHHNQVEPRR